MPAHGRRTKGAVFHAEDPISVSPERRRATGLREGDQVGVGNRVEVEEATGSRDRRTPKRRCSRPRVASTPRLKTKRRVALVRKWGHCKNCRHFASPAALPLDTEEAACKQPSLAKVNLTMFGACQAR